ncbi:hypothetical protein DAPPUDRAFT_278859, partial [Daphnia pulex]
MSLSTLSCLLVIALGLVNLPRVLAQSEAFPLPAPDPLPSERKPSAAPKPVDKTNAEAVPAKPKRRQAIKVPKHKVVKNIKDAYQSISEPHLLLILHLPKEGGAGFIELHNRSDKDLALFQFTIEALGQIGELEFEELPSGWSAVKEVRMSTLRELEIRKPRAFDTDANDFIL